MSAVPDPDAGLVAALKAGDESVFAELIDRHGPSMLRVARGYVRSTESAEEVVQDTWVALLKGVGGFEGRSSLRTWLFTVLINIAKARGARELRSAAVEVPAFDGASVGPERFRPDGDEWPGHWKADRMPAPFPHSPEDALLGAELVNLARRELDKQPERQRTVVTMRDILGFESAEVAAMLEISVANQRVLLHRGRSAIRQALEDYLKGGPR